MTRFNKVKLPASALLSDSFEAPKDPRAAWWDTLWRIPIGSFAVAGPCVSGLKHTAYIGGAYSLRRHVAPHGEKVPIFSFPTQQRSVLYSVASARVLDAWYREVAPTFADPKATHPIKHGLAVLVKATVIREAMDPPLERARPQPLRPHPRMPKSRPSPKHAHAHLEEGRQTLRRVPGGHRSEAAEYELLPESERAVVALGHACAYSAARRAGVPQVLFDLYECAAIRDDPAWFSEHAGLNREAAPDVERHLEELNVKYAVCASIVSDSSWPAQVHRMPKYIGNAQCGIPGVTPGTDGARL
jgi:hypothetical protein